MFGPAGGSSGGCGSLVSRQTGWPNVPSLDRLHMYCAESRLLGSERVPALRRLAALLARPAKAKRQHRLHRLRNKEQTRWNHPSVNKETIVKHAACHGRRGRHPGCDDINVNLGAGVDTAGRAVTLPDAASIGRYNLVFSGGVDGRLGARSLL